MGTYDVFISYKNGDKNGRPTRDAVMADALYRSLRKKNLNPFFSKYSIDESARDDYIDAIDQALECATVFVAVGTSRENLTSGWVKHEINQFRALMNAEDDKNRSIVSYRSMDFSPNELPSGLRCYQSYDDQKSVVRFIETCLQRASGFHSDDTGTELLYEDPDMSASKNSFYKQLQVGDLLYNRFEIMGCIGRGGMSQVYLAMDRHLKKMFAVKELCFDKFGESEVVMEAMRREADLLKGLSHPAIPSIYDIVDTENSFIIVMDYVEGRSLGNELSECGFFKEEQVIGFARQLGEVLDYLHSRPMPIIYRDMKPANLILQPDGMLKLIDFGTAREYKESAVCDTTCLGTVGFAAPEQYGSMGQTDARTDIYNLGATLYHLVTGKNPALPPYEILPIRKINPNLSRGLEEIIEKCTQKDPEGRYQSAKELLRALERAGKHGIRDMLRSFRKGTQTNDRQKSPVLPQRKDWNQAPIGYVDLDAQEMPVTEVLNESAGVFCPPTEILEEVEPRRQSFPVPPPPRFTASEPAHPQPAVQEHQTNPVGVEKNKVRKVAVRTKTTAAPRMDMSETIDKLLTLDAKSQQLVRELIDQLSK